MKPQITRDGMTPAALETLLHYHTKSGTPHPYHDSPAVTDARESLIELGAIRPVALLNGGYVVPLSHIVSGHDLFGTTPLGAAWVERILRTPVPSEH